jgi:hypothetical protein
MLRRYFIYFTLALLFTLTQQAAIAHEISHITDAQQSSKKQDKTTHTSFCEKCVSFGELAHNIPSPDFYIALSNFNFVLRSHLSRLDESLTETLYYARDPPAHT